MTIAKQMAKSFLLLGTLACMPSAMQAQITVVDEDADDDEIEVVGEEGVEEIEFPESMTYWTV